MSAPYTPRPPEGELDDFRCFLIDWPIDHDVYVTGVHVQPSNLTVAHHLVATLVPPEGVEALLARDAEDAEPGFDCGGGEMGAATGGIRPAPGQDRFEALQGQGLLTGWVPGARPNVLPEGTGMLVRPGSKIMMNMHYNVLAAGPGPDQTIMNFMVEDQVDKPGVAIFWTNPAWLGPRGNMLIPAGESLVEHSFSFDPTAFLTSGEPLTIHSAMLHMHGFGVSGGLSVLRAGGAECLVDIPRWDFDWQMTYGFMESTVINPGDELKIECRYNNSASNQPVIDGQQIEPQDVRWGEGGTLDEMCLGSVFLTR